MAEKTFKTYDQMLDLLESRGIVFVDGRARSKAKKILQHEGYYNLINGYKTLFLSNANPEQYCQGTTLEEIFALYDFDRSLREIFLKSILHVETNIKNLISYRISEKYGHDNYLLYKNFDTTRRDAGKHISSLISSVQSQIAAHSSDPNISHYLRNHGYLPMWVLSGILTFGNMSKFYSMMKQPDRQSISLIFNMHDNVLENFLKYLTAVRNFSAHGNRLYCFVESRPMIDTQVHSELGIPQVQGQYVQGRNDLFAAVIALKHLLSDREFKYFLKSLIGAVNKLATKLSVISIDDVLSAMGFPSNWRKILYI